MEALVTEVFNTELDQSGQKPNKPVECGICGENHGVKECTLLKVTGRIPDKTIPSKARLTLPDTLEIKKLCDGSHNVYTKCLIEKGTQFGPFQAKKLFTLLPSIDFPLKIFTNGDEDLSEYFLDTSDENECSWMIFISAANDVEEQNIICYQDGEHLYYGTTKDIYPEEPLKVWYSPFYALKMKKTVLNNSSVEENYVAENIDVEAMLRKKKNIMPRESWSCKFCGKVEKVLSVFALHLLDHYKAQASKKCAICKDSYASRRWLKKHLKIVHGNLPQAVETVKEAEIPVTKIKEVDSKDASVGGPLLLNNITADSLDNSSLLLPQTDLLRIDLNGIENQNMMMETENLNLNVDNIINENVKQLDHFNFELNEPETEQLICDICLKSFAKLKALIQHLEQHTGKFLCNQCNMVYARKENLLYHACNLFYKLKCPLCEKIFFQQKYLTLHIKGFHDKQFTCERCNKFYDTKSTLDTHNCPEVPIHKREKYPCSICPKVFFNKKNLYGHLTKHKGKSDQRRICEVCNMELSSRQIYLRHVKAHDLVPYSCDMCEKVFSRKDSLKEHKILTHEHKGQTITCDICKKTFQTKKLLKRHEEIHNEDTPYKCDICQAAFKQRANFTKHLNSQHKPAHTKAESLFKEDLLIYSCPKCHKNMKLRSSLLRHVRTLHPDFDVSSDILKPKRRKLDFRKPKGTQEDESVMDLKETIENMNFNTDEVNNCSENNDINMEIDKILNNTDNIDNFLNDSNDQMVESLISIAAKENQLGTADNQYPAKEVCLSMPDLTSEQEIKLGENAYILDNGTIVEPQESSSKVVVYILDQHKFA